MFPKSIRAGVGNEDTFRVDGGVSLIDTCYIFMTPSEEVMIYRSRYRILGASRFNHNSQHTRPGTPHNSSARDECAPASPSLICDCGQPRAETGRARSQPSPPLPAHTICLTWGRATTDGRSNAHRSRTCKTKVFVIPSVIQFSGGVTRVPCYIWHLNTVVDITEL